MATWAKQKLPRENGELVDMQVPILVSASRSTDIPAFYADWFFYRLDKAGYSAWTNPFNGVKSYVSYKDTRFIVFWSKNPKPLLRHLPILKQRGIGCYSCLIKLKILVTSYWDIQRNLCLVLPIYFPIARCKPIFKKPI